jgi:hypothetical protein
MRAMKWSIVVYAVLCLGGLTRGADLLDRTLDAICMAESRGGQDTRDGDGGRAIGPYQIHKIMVDDCNRIVGTKRWTYADRRSRAKSKEMCRTYLLHYWPKGTQEQWARGWNGGPGGPQKRATLSYWAKVREILTDTEE